MPEKHEPGRLQKVNNKVTKTYLSLSTTPSIQAPNRTTQEMSEHEVKTKYPSTECTLTTPRGHMFACAQLHMGTLVYIILSINCTYRIQMKEVVRIAIMVPNGMDLWASLRSPDLLDPAIIPEIKHKHTHAHIGVC